ncbi:MAG: aminotransferase class I/II-fold pyridoxal phosphate-dependent enzyme, partial [Candidatus Omnitrophica bacterium]|nr:aminotransferase class I/II-fold pyridoxal phosphate-dependent enzyme [Candidatus Omnitrophota bacterium]
MKNWPHGGNIRQAAEEFGIPPKEIVDFSANINPLGLPARLKKQIKRNLSEILHYPDPECKLLREEISRYLDVDCRRIIVENGSTPLIYLFVQAFIPKKVLILIPTFSEYEKALRIQRSKIRFFPLKEKN